MITTRYARNNSPTLKAYDASRPNVNLFYLDANNQYGWAMSQQLPTHGFRSLQPDEIEALAVVVELSDDAEDGYIWIHMDTYGCIWMHMDTYGCIWIHMDTYGCIWIHMDAYGCIWMKMDTYGCIWIHMDTYGYIWMKMDTYGCIWIHMDTYG